MTDAQAKHLSVRRIYKAQIKAKIKYIDSVLAQQGYERNKKLWKEPGDRRTS